MIGHLRDFLFADHGSVTLLTPITAGARAWIIEHVSQDVTYFGRSVVIEPRYVDDILAGIDGDGLTVGY